MKLDDPRLDRIITWILGIMVSAALSAGAWMFKDLRDEIKHLNMNVRDLTVQVAVLEEANKTISALRGWVVEQQSQDREDRQHLRERIRELERMMDNLRQTRP